MMSERSVKKTKELDGEMIDEDPPSPEYVSAKDWVRNVMRKDLDT